MEFPNIQTKATSLTLTDALVDLLEKRLQTLGKLLPEDETSISCDVELEKITDHHQTGKIYRAEINLRIGGKLYRAESTEERIEDAIDRAKNDLKTELRRSKDKRQSLMRRGGQKLKDLIRFGQIGRAHV